MFTAPRKFMGTGVLPGLMLSGVMLSGLMLSGCGGEEEEETSEMNASDTLIVIPDTLTLIPEASIVIDGNDDDWAGVDAVMTDASGDAAYGGLDVTSLYLAQDSDALYLRLDLVSAVRPAEESYNYWVYFENDDGYEFAVEHYHDSQSTPYIRLWDITGADRNYDAQTELTTLSAHTSGSVMEVQIPKSQISTSLNYRVDFYTHHTVDQTWYSNGDDADEYAYVQFSE